MLGEVSTFELVLRDEEILQKEEVGKSIPGKGQGHKIKANSKKGERFRQERCHHAHCG